MAYKDPAKQKEYKKKQYRANKEKILQQVKEYRESNKQKISDNDLDKATKDLLSEMKNSEGAMGKVVSSLTNASQQIELQEGF